MRGRFKGVYCASVTPMRGEAVDTAALVAHLHALKADSCDGVLLMGTTGEGPSLALAEREAIVEAAVAAKTGLSIMAGTGTPNLPETIQATRRAFELGADAVVVIPPYYFCTATEAGLLAYYRAVMDAAVPEGKTLFAYHIPQVSGVSVPPSLLVKLSLLYGDRFGGVKDSGGDMGYAGGLITTAPDLDVFVGSEKLLLTGLQQGAAGCITAGANVLAAQAAAVYRSWQAGEDAEAAQNTLSAARTILDGYAPAPSSLKALLALKYGGESWDVRPPLMPLPDDQRAELVEKFSAR
ncbi:MAG: dihydrodipicolinate synthase family protein [Anaerolineae bacterium]|nr:dihydrodipicolinate synthase family protein [Anaerolineae bacterium]